METINIKGKEYVTVAERIKYFRSQEEYKNFGIEIEWIRIDEKIAIAKATIKNQSGIIISTGTAMEERDEKSFINKNSYIENCETSAVGRALGILGIGVAGDIATYEEVLRNKKKNLIDSINLKIDDENIKEYEKKYNLDNLEELGLEKLEELENQLILDEKEKICKALVRIATQEEIGNILEKYKTNMLEKIDYKELINIHDNLVKTREEEKQKEERRIKGINTIKEKYVKSTLEEKTKIMEEMTKVLKKDNLQALENASLDEVKRIYKKIS